MATKWRVKLRTERRGVAGSMRCSDVNDLYINIG